LHGARKVARTMNERNDLNLAGIDVIDKSIAVLMKRRGHDSPSRRTLASVKAPRSARPLTGFGR
jgi:hypothetical protein